MFKVGDWVRIWGRPTKILRVVEPNVLHEEPEVEKKEPHDMDGII